MFGLLGPNGSGKTTTLLIISTVYKPTSGEVYVYGHDVIREGDVVMKYVGIAFQEPKALWVDKPYELLLWHGSTVVIATNDMFEAERMCERIAIIYKGKLKALGSVEELKDSTPEDDIVELMLDGDESTYLRADGILKQYGKTVRSNDSLKIFLNKGEERAIEILDFLSLEGLKYGR